MDFEPEMKTVILQICKVIKLLIFYHISKLKGYFGHILFPGTLNHEYPPCRKVPLDSRYL